MKIRKLAVLLLLTLPLLPLRAQQIIQQPVSQTVQAGSPASFTVVVSGGPCRSLWLINGIGHYGALASSITYTFPATTLTQNNTNVQVQLYGCASGTLKPLSSIATLTVINVITLQSILLGPVAPIIGIGQTQIFTVTGQYNDGSTKDLSSTATFVSDTPSVASLSGNVATGLLIGSAIISATYGTVTGSTALIVLPPIAVSISALYDDNSVPILQLIIRQIMSNGDGTFTATPVLGLIPDTTGVASGTFLLDPALNYDAMIMMNSVPIATPNFYSAAALLALMPQISKASFEIVLFKSSGLIKSYADKAQ